MKSMVLLCALAVGPASAQEAWFSSRDVGELKTHVQRTVTELKVGEKAAKPRSGASPIHDFKCATESPIERKGHRGVTRFSFSVINLEAGTIGFFTTAETDTEPVTMDPVDSVLDLNDNYGIMRTRKTQDIKLDADSDGFADTVVLLYADKGYKAGFARVTDHDGGKGIYSKVICQVRKRA